MRQCPAPPLLQFFFLLVALLLKVNLDGEGSAAFFSGIVGMLSVLPVTLPVALTLYARLFGSLETRAVVSDNAWG